MLKVYQIHLSAADQAQIELEGWSAAKTNPKIKAYFDRMFAKPENVVLCWYTHVADVMTDDMEEAFELMNLWEDMSRVRKIGRAHSMSVGDVIEDEAGNHYLCASFGFEKID